MHEMRGRVSLIGLWLSRPLPSTDLTVYSESYCKGRAVACRRYHSCFPSISTIGVLCLSPTSESFSALETLRRNLDRGLRIALVKTVFLMLHVRVAALCFVVSIAGFREWLISASWSPHHGQEVCKIDSCPVSSEHSPLLTLTSMLFFLNSPSSTNHRLQCLNTSRGTWHPRHCICCIVFKCYLKKKLNLEN